MQKQSNTYRDSSPIRFTVTPGKIFSMGAANTAVAIFIHVVHPESIFVDSFIYSQCIGISIATCTIIAINYFKARSMATQTAFIAAAIVMGAVIGMSAGSATVYFFSPTGAFPVQSGEKYKSLVSNLAYALLFGSIINYIFMSLQKLSDEKIKRLEVEKNAAVTEIRLLQSQMEPHFLFNTLSNILGLIECDPQKASRMLESFTSFLRTSLVIARSETITLAQEMDVVKNYLDIFSVRMGDRLRYRIDVSDELHGFRIPPLLIQPLVENAVKHGLELFMNGGELLVQGRRDGDWVIISVIDSGVGINELSPGNGIGLENVKKRLNLLYEGRGKMIFEENEPSGVRAVIEIPYETDTSHLG